jgi:hypothetical protein
VSSIYGVLCDDPGVGGLLRPLSSVLSPLSSVEILLRYLLTVSRLDSRVESLVPGGVEESPSLVCQVSAYKLIQRARSHEPLQTYSPSRCHTCDMGTAVFHRLNPFSTLVTVQSLASSGPYRRPLWRVASAHRSNAPRGGVNGFPSRSPGLTWLLGSLDDPRACWPLP